jgi:hypothetical protein
VHLRNGLVAREEVVRFEAYFESEREREKALESLGLDRWPG